MSVFRPARRRPPLHGKLSGLAACRIDNQQPTAQTFLTSRSHHPISYSEAGMVLVTWYTVLGYNIHIVYFVALFGSAH